MSAIQVRYAQLGTVVATKIEFGRVAVQMLLAAVPIDADQATFEDTKEAFEGVGIGIALAPLLGAAPYEAMGDEVLLELVYWPASSVIMWVSAAMLTLRIGSRCFASGAVNVEGHDTAAVLHEGEVRVLVSVAATDFGA